MTFATQLSNLLQHLRQLPPTTPSHVQHLIIRVERAKTQAAASDHVNGLESLVRLRNRLQELEEGLNEVEASTSDTSQWNGLRRDTREAIEGLEKELEDATTKLLSRNSTSSHSRSSSADLSRRVPSSQPQPSTNPAPTNPDLDAFLSRVATTSSQPSTLSTLASNRAKVLSQAYSLFLLCINPSSILPSGQTLSTLFNNAQSHRIDSTRSSTSTNPSRLDFASLSEDLIATSATINRRQRGEAWNHIKRDLSTVVLPLIPSRSGQGTVRKEIERVLSSSQVEGTENDELESEMITTLQPIVQVLSKLCAPVRDQEILSILERLNSILSSTSSQSKMEEVLDLVQQVYGFAETMQRDLDEFRAKARGNLEVDEGELREVLREEAGERERKGIREVVAGVGVEKGVADEKIRKETKEWIERKRGRGTNGTDDVELTKEEVVQTLVDSLFEDSAAGLPPLPSSPSSSRSSNSLPPIFYAVSPRLFEIQNRLQAIVILACLLTVVVPPPPLPKQNSSTLNPITTLDHVNRLWTILESEIVKTTPNSTDQISSSGHNHDKSIDDKPDPTPTRIAHLSDELISYRRSSTSTLDSTEIDRIKSSSDRILRYQDPVFKLLRSRLKTCVVEVVVKYVINGGESEEPGMNGTMIPSNLRTGRKSSSVPSTTIKPTQTKIKILSTPPKGFERLTIQIGELLEEDLRPVWDWVVEVWGETVFVDDRA